VILVAIERRILHGQVLQWLVAIPIKFVTRVQGPLGQDRGKKLLGPGNVLIMEIFLKSFALKVINTLQDYSCRLLIVLSVIIRVNFIITE